MQFVEARRLTGPNLLAGRPLVIVELVPEGETRAAVERAYLVELDRMRAALGWSATPPVIVREHAHGVVIAYDAPIDVMLAHAEASEWAGQSAVEILAGRPGLPLEPKRTEIAAMFAAQTCHELLVLEAEARRRELPLCWDDDEVSLGSGPRSFTWPRTAVPSAIDWSAIGRIPIALVTGTNGKTTSTRMLARVVREAGLRSGNTSSDEVSVGEAVIDRGDWTGPFAARLVLRRTDVDVAILETARGGILRRGLAVNDCDVALITNVTEDHTGSYGIDDLAAMTQVKAVIARVARKAVVLNARDPKLVALASELAVPVTFFADLDAPGADAAREVLAAHAGGKVVAQAGRIEVAAEGGWRALVRVDDVPLTFGGAARHNVENALGVAATALALGLPEDAVVRGLRGFTTKDNARRGEILERGGIKVVLDFGHNPEGVRAILKLAAALRERADGRMFVSIGTPGDRTLLEIGEMSRGIVAAGAAGVVAREMPGYLRGKQPGEVPALFERALREHGFAGPVATAPDEVSSLELLLADARPGDVVVVLVHLEAEKVHALLGGWQ